MLLSVPRRKLPQALDVFESEDVEATVLGRFTRGQTLSVSHLGISVLKLNLRFLYSPPKVKRTAEIRRIQNVEPRFDSPPNLENMIKRLHSAPNIASKEQVIRTYDHEVQGNTVLKPLQAAFAAPNDAAVLKPLPESWRGIVISSGINPNYAKLDPYWMAGSVIDEALRNNVAVGGRRIALLDNFTWGSPEKPDRMWGLLEACRGCYDFAKGFGTPFVSGKDSLYNESPLGSVAPTLLVSGLGIIPDVRWTVSVELKKPGNSVYVVGVTYQELGGSEYFRLIGISGGLVPRVRIPTAKRIMRTVTLAIDRGYVKSCHDLSEGGLAVAAAEMALGTKFGLDLDLNSIKSPAQLRDDIALFSESNTRFLIEVDDARTQEFESLTRKIPCSKLGEVQDDGNFIIRRGKDVVVSMGVGELRAVWKSSLEAT